MTDFSVVSNEEYKIIEKMRQNKKSDYWMISKDTIVNASELFTVYERNEKYYITMPVVYVGSYGPPTFEIQVYSKKDALTVLLGQLKDKCTQAISLYHDTVVKYQQDI